VAASVSVPDAHDWLRQVVDDPGYVQAVGLPPHAPPHAVPSVAHGARDPWGAPEGTVVQTPGDPFTSHA
jgi:hypothetical protein